MAPFLCSIQDSDWALRFGLMAFLLRSGRRVNTKFAFVAVPIMLALAVSGCTGSTAASGRSSATSPAGSSATSAAVSSASSVATSSAVSSSSASQGSSSAEEEIGGFTADELVLIVNTLAKDQPDVVVYKGLGPTSKPMSPAEIAEVFTTVPAHCAEFQSEETLHSDASKFNTARYQTAEGSMGEFVILELTSYPTLKIADSMVTEFAKNRDACGKYTFEWASQNGSATVTPVKVTSNAEVTEGSQQDLQVANTKIRSYLAMARKGTLVIRAKTFASSSEGGAAKLAVMINEAVAALK